jgi:hypothetical protein
MSRTLVALLIAAAALLIPASASGVWGGDVDSGTPPRYPQVGAVYFDYEGSGQPRIDGFFCSGSYAGPSKAGTPAHDVFLLAGHCLAPPVDSIDPGDLWVSFSSNANVLDTSEFVADPIQVEQYIQMPGFGKSASDLHDLGILLLPPDSVQGIDPIELAPVGYLDTLKKQKQLNFRRIALVGYGFQPDWASPGPTTFSFDGKRRFGSSVVTGLGKATVHFQQNKGIGTGSGACIGDSGSPQIDENVSPAVVVSVMSGGNGQCNSVNVNYRVDTPQARAFLGQFVDLS